MKTPEILNEIVEVLRKANLQANASVAGEGRHGSLKDEEMIVNYLISKFGDRIKETPARRFGDMIVDNELYVNIKTDEFGDLETKKNKIKIGSGTNSFSTCGFAYALSDASVDEIGGSMNYFKFTDLLNKNKEDNDRDYYFLALNKRNMKDVFVRGSKQINSYGCNPRNMLQVDFGFEYVREPANRTHNEAKKYIVNCIKECIIKKQKQDNYLLENL